MGTFLALDLFLFFVMFEITLVPGYFIISGWGGFRRNYAAMKFFIYTFAGSAFLFVAILALVLLTAPANHGHETFDLITLARLASGLPARRSGADLRRLRRRLRRQDPAGAVPQLAARRLHRGAHGRLHDPGRASCSSWAPTGCCASGCSCCPAAPPTWARCCSPWRPSASPTAP